MPIGNNFQHASYARSDPGERVSYRECSPGAVPAALAWQDAMARLGARVSQAGVRAVLFLHGTFLSSDLFGVRRLDEAGGLKRGYSRGIPGMEALLALMREGSNGLPALPGGKKPPLVENEATTALIDELSGDAANFTRAYVELFQKALNRNGSRPIVCTRLLWSCEHHHLGRAQAAIRLLTRLRSLCAELKLGAGDRILVQAHGQAGPGPSFLSNPQAPRAPSALRVPLERPK